jgi:hypothetical protein
MNNRFACLAAFAALSIVFGSAACTDDDAPPSSPGTQATDEDSRAGMDDIVVTEAALEPFIGMDGDRAYAQLRRQHFEVRFGPMITKFERKNILGIQTHPDVVIETLQLGPNEEVIITRVSCRSRSESGEGGYC